MNRIFVQIALTLLVNLSYAQKQVLGFNLAVGETYYHNIQSKSQIHETFNGQDVTIDIEVKGRTSFKVRGKTDSTYNMDVRYEQLTMTTNLPTGSATYSSESSDTSDLMSKVLRVFKERYFGMTLTRVGKIIEVKNLDTIFASIVKELSEVPAQRREQMVSQLQKSFGEKTFKANFELVTFIYSNTPVEVGNNWKVFTTFENSVNLSVATTFEWKQKDPNFNLISGIGTITPAEGEPLQINGMPVKYDLNGTSDWQLKVDSKTGWVIEGNMKQHIKGSLQIQDNPKAPGGMDIPMTIEGDYNFSGK